LRAAEAEVAPADAAYLEAFEAGGVAPESFHHRDHVRLIWTYLRMDGLEQGGDRMAGAIRRFAEAHAPGKYHETITRAWIRLVWAALAESPGAGFEAFLEAHPDLADKGRLRAFYRPETLASDAARGSWCEPDLKPLPSS
jgi:hypothetical protein